MARYKFTSHDLTMFRRLLDRLGLTQKEFGKQANLTEAWISQVLAGIRKGAELKTLDRITKTFQRLAEERQRAGEITEADLEEVLRDIEGFRSPAQRGTAGPFFSDPGGPVPLGAKNYIDPLPKVLGTERPFRDQIAHFLRAKFFSASLFGPPQSGVTSLLLRFMDQAEKSGMSTALFDCKKIVDYIEPNGTAEALGTFTNYLARSLAQFWGKSTPAIASSGDFLDWLEEEFSDADIRLLIVDNLSSLGVLAMPFLDFVVRPIQTLRGSKVKLNLAFGIHPEDMKQYAEFRLSPVLGTQIDLAWLREKQTHELAEIFDEGKHAADFFEQYGGQPFLTHIAIAYARQAKSNPEAHRVSLTVAKIHNLAKQAEGAFAQHYNLIKDLLVPKDGEGITENGPLDSLMNICQKKPLIDELQFSELEVAEFLVTAGMVKKLNERYETTLPLYCTYGKKLRRIYPKGLK